MINPQASMKHILGLTSLFVTLGAMAQGTVAFANKWVNLDQKVYNWQFVPLSGPDYYAQLFAGPDYSSLAPIGAPVPFRTGTGVGYWNWGPSATRTIDTVAPGGTVIIEVRAWDNDRGSIATWDAAVNAGRPLGQSDTFRVVLGDASTPAVMTGFRSFLLIVPEPSALTLALLGLGALWFGRKRPAAPASRPRVPPEVAERAP
jgi:hypothetical protein